MVYIYFYLIIHNKYFHIFKRFIVTFGKGINGIKLTKMKDRKNNFIFMIML